METTNQQVTLAHDKIHKNLRSFMLSCALNGAFETDYEMEKRIHRMNLYLHEEGTACYTNFANIYLGLKSPVLTSGSLDDQYRAAQTIIGHEVAHIRFTDKPSWDQFINKSRHTYKGLARFATDVLNIVEDRRIEYLMGLASPFLQKRFFLIGASSSTDLEASIRSMVEKPDVTARDRLLAIRNALLYVSHMRMLPTIYDNQVTVFLQRCFPHVLRARKGNHTSDAVRATENILLILEPLMTKCREEAEDDIPPLFPLKGETGTSDPLSGEKVHGEEWSHLPPEVEEALDSIAENGGDVTDITKALEAAGNVPPVDELIGRLIPSGEKEQSITDQIIRDFLQTSDDKGQTWEESKEAKKISLLGHSLGTGLHRGCVPEFAERSKMERFSMMDYQQNVAELQPLINDIVTNIEEIVQHKTDQYLYDQRSGRLDPRKLTRFNLFNELDIFRQVDTEEHTMELEVMLLVDVSGSNGSSVLNQKNGVRMPRFVANQMVAIILHEALKRLKFKHSVWTFHSGGKTQYFSNIMDYSNCFKSDAGVYLKEIGAKGDNRDGYAIRYAGNYLVQQANQPKRLLLVLSDGEPSSSGYGGESAMKDVRQATEEVTDAGAKVIGIFTGHPSENRYFHDEEHPEQGMYEKALFANNDQIFDLPGQLKTVLLQEFEEHLDEILS